MPPTDDARSTEGFEPAPSALPWIEPDGFVDVVAASGRTLGNPIGRGASGTVWRAVEADGSASVVKLLDPGVDTKRFRSEIAALRSLHHPGIPALLDVLELGPRPAIVMERVVGDTLLELLRSGPLAPQRAVAIFSSLAEVLNHVHDRGVVHRDLSPDNIVVGPSNSVSLVDFGISMSPDAATMTAGGLAAGTPRYLAPEVIGGDEPSPASDQYSAGIVLSEMLTGRWPYPDAGDNVASVLHHHLNTDPVVPSETNPWLGTDFDDAVRRSLCKAPSDRFATVGDMTASFGQTPPRKRAPGFLPAAAVVGVVGLLAVGAFAVRGDNTSDEPWASGTAASLACNLLEQPDFESGSIPAGYFDQATFDNDLSTNGGVDRTAAVRVGISGEFGLYGEAVPIVPGEGYVFSAYLAPTADVGAAFVRLFTLDENFDIVARPDNPEIGVDEVEVELAPGSARFVSVVVDNVDPRARFLVPSLVKEGSQGYLLADELVLAPSNAQCTERLPG